MHLQQCKEQEAAHMHCVAWTFSLNGCKGLVACSCTAADTGQSVDQILVIFLLERVK